MTMKQLPLRAEVPEDRTWNKLDVYSSDEAWEQALSAASEDVATLGRFRGQMASSAATLLEALRTRDEWEAWIWCPRPLWSKHMWCWQK